MTTELVLFGPAGAPMSVAGRAGISSALIVDEPVACAAPVITTDGQGEVSAANGHGEATSFR
jgi:hypothetical protein